MSPLRYDIFSSILERYCSYSCLTYSSWLMYSMTTWLLFRWSFYFFYRLTRSLSASSFKDSLSSSSFLLSYSLRRSPSLNCSSIRRCSFARSFNSVSNFLSCCRVLASSSVRSFPSPLSLDITFSNAVICFSTLARACFSESASDRASIRLLSTPTNSFEIR